MWGGGGAAKINWSYGIMHDDDVMSHQLFAQTEHRTAVRIYPVAPVAYQVILEPVIGQFREFEPPRVHTGMNSGGLFLVHKLTCGNRESVR